MYSGQVTHRSQLQLSSPDQLINDWVYLQTPPDPTEIVFPTLADPSFSESIIPESDTFSAEDSDIAQTPEIRPDSIDNFVIETVEDPNLDLGVETAVIQRPAPPDPTEQMVFAHYMAWFRTPEETGRWLHWSWDPDGDGGLDPEDRLPYVTGEDGLADLATAHYPLIGPYDSSDPHLIEYHIASAWASGLNGFVVDWYGPKDDGGVDRATQRLALQIKQWRRQYQLPFFVALAYEEQILFKVDESKRVERFIEHMTYLLETYASQDGYLTYEGLPVVFYFEMWHDGEPGLLSPQELEMAFEQLPEFHFLYMGAETEYLDAIDGFFTWIGGTNQDQNDWGADYSNWIFPEQDYQSSQHQYALTVGSVWAGFDDSAVQGWDPSGLAVPRLIDRQKGDVFAKTWESALQDLNNHQRVGPSWIQVVTWNDWNEGSEIEPSLEYGRYYLEQTQQFTELYTGEQFVPEALSIPEAIYLYRKRVPEAELNQLFETVYVLFFQKEFEQAIDLLVRSGVFLDQ